MPRQPQISVLRNPSFGFPLLPGSEGPLYVLEHEWEFNVVLTPPQGLRRMKIPRGYEFDGASVPAFFWGFPFGYTPFGLHISAALEHDFLCDLGHGGSDWLRERLTAEEMRPLTWQETHGHFARRLNEDGLRPRQVWMMGRAVLWFGPRWKVPG